CRAGFAKKAEVVIFLNRTAKSVEQGLDASTFRLGCTPVINLFEQAAEPVALTPTRYEYRIVPDAAHPLGMEVYAVESVTIADPAPGAGAAYEPFYSVRPPRAPEGRPAFWYTTRHPAVGPDDRGTDVDLHLVDLNYQPHLPPAAVLQVRTLC